MGGIDITEKNTNVMISAPGLNLYKYKYIVQSLNFC